MYPWLNKKSGAYPELNQWTTATSFISSKADEGTLVSGTSYVVRLFYIPKSCYSPSHFSEPGGMGLWKGCPKTYKSNAVILNAGNVPTPFGPGALVGASGSSGDFAETSISGNVVDPQSFEVRVASSPSGQDVDVYWDITCSKGYSVRGGSGSFSDTTPVDDPDAFPIPIFQPDSCIVSVLAALSNGSGGISLHVYFQRWS